MLDVELHRAHVEAHLLEHAISPYLEERIMKKLGNADDLAVRVSDTGHRLCAKRGVIRLNEAEVGRDLVIDKIPVDDEVLWSIWCKNQ
ncbi:hypothetical protein GBAR_LOCUS21046, partial [Geodia barretti]